MAALQKLGARLLTLADPDYPQTLAATPDAPPVLSVRGHVHLLERPGIAIVGARNASANGRTLAERLARDLGEAGYLVVSGLARGIDAAAHRGALPQATRGTSRAATASSPACPMVSSWSRRRKSPAPSSPRASPANRGAR